MALYIPHSIFHLARLLYVRQETFGLVPAYDNLKLDSYHSLSLIDALMRLKFTSIIVGIIN